MIQFKNENPSVLLVEDDPEQRRLLEVGLDRHGHRVAAVRDARGAIARLTLESFDVVVSDLGLPGMRGDELLRHIRQINQAQPFVMLTGESDVATAVQAVRDGADEYLTKPATVNRVRESILTAINHRSEINQNERVVKYAHFGELRGFLTGVRSLVNSLEAKDQYTKNHSKKVAQIALMMARSLPGISHRQIREIRIGAWLHDIGKIAIPLTILHKDGPLDPEEWDVVKQHTVQGAKIVEPLAKKYPEIQRIVRHEHERWDGRGYPDGIKGNDIPLGSRLIMIADTYDAICSTRPYRKALPKAAALDVIRKGAGTQFDPNLVPIFEETYESFPYSE